MSRIFVTGSTEGLGLAAAQALMDDGHEVVLHARSGARAARLSEICPKSSGIVIGDLSSAAETRSVARQVNGFGRMHAVVHNAGVYAVADRGSTSDGHALTLAVNVLAPYMLTALVTRPERIVFISSSLHRGASSSLRDIDWVERPWNQGGAYSESKLYLVTLALALARLWPDVLSNVVDPGWVPTRMGGPNAPDDLVLGSRTQAWLAVGNDPAARVSGAYWYHQEQQDPAPDARDAGFQHRLMRRLAELTDTPL